MNGTWMASSRSTTGKAHFFPENQETSLCGKMKNVSKCRQNIELPDWKLENDHTCPVCRAYIIWHLREIAEPVQ
jgi:hypothetical protein